MDMKRMAVALLTGLLGVSGTAAARSTDHAQDPVVALQFDNSTSTMFKATEHALYSSSDGGRTWTQLPLPSLKRGAAIAGIAVSAAVQKKYVLYVAGPGIGVLRTEDAGRNWLARHKGLPAGGVVALAAHADQHGTLYVSIAGKGIFRSENTGLHWKLMDGGPRDAILRLIHSNMPGSMQTGWFFAATAKGVRRSMDCFCGWRDAGALGRPVNSIAYDPREPQYVYAATDEGLFVSTNGGEQWQRVKAPAAGLTALVATPSGDLYAAARDGALFHSKDRGATWMRVDA